MFQLLKYIVQLLLSPAHGWEDLKAEEPSATRLLQHGVYPLLGVAAATMLLGLAYGRATLAQALIGAVYIFGAYFVAIFIARLLFDLYLNRVAGIEVDKDKAYIVILCGIAMMATFQIIENCLPWNLMIVRFLPLYGILVLSKSSTYLGISKRKELSYTVLASLAIVVVPWLIYYIFYLLIQ